MEAQIGSGIEVGIELGIESGIAIGIGGAVVVVVAVGHAAWSEDVSIQARASCSTLDHGKILLQRYLKSIRYLCVTIH